MILKRFGHYTKARTKAVLACASLLGISFGVQAQQFKPMQRNPWTIRPANTTNLLLSPAVGDLDGDGDLDVLSVSFAYVGAYSTSNLNVFQYHANIGNDSIPDFDSVQIAPFALSVFGGFGTPTFFRCHPNLVDIDGDGDLDLIVSGFAMPGFSNSFEYFPNIGSPTAPEFGGSIGNPFGLTDIANATLNARFVDIDGDGDKDLFAAGDSTIYYYPNTGSATAPLFGAVQTNPFGIDNNQFGSASGVTINFHDFDGDGDLDLLAGASVTHRLGSRYRYFYVENIGTASAPAFGAPQINPFGLSASASSAVQNPVLADFDNDGDMDIFGGHNTNNYSAYAAIFFHIEDTAARPVAIQKTLAGYHIQAMPNPTSGQVELRIEAPADRTQKLQLAVINLLGAVVETRPLSLNGGQTRISLDMSHLPAGQYQLRLTDDKRSHTQRIIKQ